MGKINVGKVIVGGLVAGVLLNLGDYVIGEYIMKAQFEAAGALRNVTPDMMAAAIPASIAIDFAVGLLLLFTYAAIRPRFGAGPRTAIISALIVVGAMNLCAGYFAGMGYFTWSLWSTMLLLTGVNGSIAGLVGAALYKE